MNRDLREPGLEKNAEYTMNWPGEQRLDFRENKKEKYIYMQHQQVTWNF